MVIYTEPKKYFSSDLSKVIDVFEPVTKGDPQKFIGHTMINGQAPFQFVIDADSLVDAFTKYDETLEAEMIPIREQMEAAKSKIVMPDRDIKLV